MRRKKTNIGVLISGGGTNMQAISKACKEGKIDGRIIFVGSDNPSAGGLAWAKDQGIRTFSVDYQKMINSWKASRDLSLLPVDFEPWSVIKKQRLVEKDTDDGNWCEDFIQSRVFAEAELLKKISKYSIDLLVLAGFMRVLTPYFIDRINVDSQNPCIMNIHPALLPAFPGVDGYGDTIRYGCKVGGCTVHFVDYGEDSGPIIGQRAIPVLPEDTIDSFREKGLQQEYELYPECIQLFAEGRLKVVENGKGRKIVSIV